jgi:hypothetical protein
VQPLFDYNGSNTLGHLKNLLVQGGVEHEKDDLYYSNYLYGRIAYGMRRQDIGNS